MRTNTIGMVRKVYMYAPCSRNTRKINTTMYVIQRSRFSVAVQYSMKVVCLYYDYEAEMFLTPTVFTLFTTMSKFTFFANNTKQSC